MSLKFLIIIVDKYDGSAKKENQITQGEPIVSARATQSSWSSFQVPMNLIVTLWYE